MIQESLQTVIAGQDLTREQSFDVMSAIMEGKATQAQIGAFLVAAKLKGETYQEVAGFAGAMREKATRVPLKRADAVDIVGTGGDGAHTFNISTVAAFVVAGAGIPVAKHGNRSVSSKCGSADVLEMLGINISLSAEQMGRCVDEVGIGFLFAPTLHTAMKHAMGPRKELGVRTVFNILGPLTNPSGVLRQVVGVFDLEVAELMAHVLRELGSEHALVVHSEDGLDEVSIFAPTTAFEVKDSRIAKLMLTPEDFGLKTANKSGKLGGLPAVNARIALSVLDGKAGPERDFVVANAAAGLYVGGAATSFSEAADIARETLDAGRASEKLTELRNLTNGLTA